MQSSVLSRDREGDELIPPELAISKYVHSLIRESTIIPRDEKPHPGRQAGIQSMQDIVVRDIKRFTIKK
jgi:hypothetical protein